MILLVTFRYKEGTYKYKYIDLTGSTLKKTMVSVFVVVINIINY